MREAPHSARSSPIRYAYYRERREHEQALHILGCRCSSLGRSSGDVPLDTDGFTGYPGGKVSNVGLDGATIPHDLAFPLGQARGWPRDELAYGDVIVYEKEELLMSPIRLREAPIREAVVDIQGVTPAVTDPDEFLPKLKAAHAHFKADYPNLQEMVQGEIKLQKKIGDPPTVTSLLLGYMFRSSAAPPRAVQFRRNGYTFSWMKPYQNWPRMIECARQGWDVYQRIVPDFTVNRVAVRFINQFKVPLPLQEEHLLHVPKPLTDPETYAGLKAFTEQMTTVDMTSGATVNLTRLINRASVGALETQAIVDIDVFREVSLRPEESGQIWEILPAFREVKNRVFYKCVGPAAIRTFGGVEE